MSLTESFLSANQEELIVNAIIKAEQKTSGEIRVHIEQKSNQPALERAKEVFNKLEMYKTNARNGVLFYINVSQKQFAVLGDKGINDKVPDDFWETTKNLVIESFANLKFVEGLVNGITEAGNQLNEYFPIQDDDINELPNEITKS